MTHTIHSTVRRQQRGFSKVIESLIWEFGEYQYLGDGFQEIFIPKSKLKYLLRSKRISPKARELLKKHSDKILKKAFRLKGEVVITSLNKTKKIKR